MHKFDILKVYYAKEIYMAWSNMFSTEKVEQKSAKAIHYTFRSYSPYIKDEIYDIQKII